MCDISNPAFANEDKARELLEATRWPDGIVCPFCGQLDTVKAVQGNSMGAGWYYCSECQDKFTVRVGTLYERSHIPLHKWLFAMHLMTSSKKGIQRPSAASDAWHHLQVGVVHGPSHPRGHDAEARNLARLVVTARSWRPTHDYIGGKESNKH